MLFSRCPNDVQDIALLAYSTSALAFEDQASTSFFSQIELFYFQINPNKIKQKSTKLKFEKLMIHYLSFFKVGHLFVI